MSPEKYVALGLDKTVQRARERREKMAEAKEYRRKYGKDYYRVLRNNKLCWICKQPSGDYSRCPEHRDKRKTVIRVTDKELK